MSQEKQNGMMLVSLALAVFFAFFALVGPDVRFRGAVFRSNGSQLSVEPFEGNGRTLYFD